MITIKQGKIFINGKQTSNAEYIGYAILDLAEAYDKTPIEVSLNSKGCFVKEL